MFKTLKFIWLFAAIAALIGAAINAMNTKFEEAGIFIIITFIAAYMFNVNHKRIKNLPHTLQDNQPNSTLP
jgi:hypothetical protein